MISRAFVGVSFLGAALACAVPASAQQYRWVDASGRVQFSDTPPPPSAREVRRLSAPSGAPDNAALPYEIARLQKDFPVTLYTTPTCKAGCDSARNALNRRGIPFREVSVVDPQTTEELQKVSGGLQVPTMLVGRQVERGFEQSSFDTLLDSAGYPKEGTVPARKPAAKPVAAKPAAEPPAQAKRGRYDLGGLGGISGDDAKPAAAAAPDSPPATPAESGK
jgi:glutaredoxin